MTETTEWQLPTTPVIPAGRDPLDDLTTGELGHIGKLLKYDPVAAVKDPATGLRWYALAHIAWVWARRLDGRAKLQPFLDSTATTVAELLRFGDPVESEDQVASENPTDSTPAS